MTPDFAGELIIYLGILAAFLIVLGIGGLIADFVFPHIPFIQKWLDGLPEYEDDEEIARLYEKEYQEWRDRRRTRAGAFCSHLHCRLVNKK